LEGGVRVPAMAWWPGMIAPNQDPVAILHITDLFTTAARPGRNDFYTGRKNFLKVLKHLLEVKCFCAKKNKVRAVILEISNPVGIMFDCRLKVNGTGNIDSLTTEFVTQFGPAADEKRVREFAEQCSGQHRTRGSNAYYG
jgi:hypothetical protein